MANLPGSQSMVNASVPNHDGSQTRPFLNDFLDNSSSALVR